MGYGYVILAISGPRAGMYVAKPGSEHSYTKQLELARVYESEAEAKRDLCPENEQIMSLSAIFE